MQICCCTVLFVAILICCLYSLSFWICQIVAILAVAVLFLPLELGTSHILERYQSTYNEFIAILLELDSFPNQQIILTLIEH